ncbi:MAG: hypothetical protein ACRDVM_03030, partial [Acidimicrobiia bacterium]
NRRWSFRIRQGRVSAGEGGSFFVVNFAAMAVTAVIVKGAELTFPGLGVLGYNLANLVAAGGILLPKFAAYRDVVFRRSLARHRRI